MPSAARVSLPSGFIHELAAATSRERVLSATAKWMPHIIEAERSSVALPSDGLHLQIYAMSGPLIIPQGTQLPINGSLVGQAFSSQQIVTVPDLVDSRSAEAHRLLDFGLRSAIVCPMVIGGRSLGTINLGNSKPNFFTPKHGQKLRTIVDLVASFIGAHARAESEYERASTDQLTSSLSRSAILEHLDQAFAQDRKPSLLYLDVDGFKTINDTHGHLHGDELLRVLAQRVEGVVREVDRLGRLGGDEFLIVVAEDPEGSAARRIAERIGAVCEAPVMFQSVRVQAKLSIGIASVPPTIGTAQGLLNDADEAMYEAKRSTNATAVADERIRSRARMVATIDRDLDIGLRTGTITHHFQPVRDITTREIMGAEALIRWDHALLGKIPPPLLVQRLERTGRTDAFTEWTLRTVAAHWCDLRRRIPWFRDKAVSVNLSPRQLAWRDYADVHRAISDEFDLRPEDLIVEVVESEEISIGDPAEQTLQALGEAGVLIALDDFGTGHNALSYLTRFQIAAIKFDRSLVSQANKTMQARTILAGLASICHELSIASLAEGIETEAEARVCQQLGITHGQGWHFGYPVPLETFVGEVTAEGPPVRLAGGLFEPLEAASTATRRLVD